MRFHVLGVPHTVTVPEYSTCAFTQKIIKLCKMLRSSGNWVVHYGHEDSRLDCSQHVTVTTRDDIEACYPGHDWRVSGFPNFNLNDSVYETFHRNAIAEIERRKEPGDFLLCPFGAGHRPIADAHNDMIVCEPGIGYPGGGFAPFKVFESYAVMHAFAGADRVNSASNSMWYDVVIPNYFDPADFTFSEDHDDYLLFLGRIGPGKGTHIAVQIAEATGQRLIVAGMGAVTDDMRRTETPLSDYVWQIGVVGPDQRRRLLSRAAATICASTYLEPFCGVQVESMMSGTPVISTDWGAFTEVNIHGVTGYRCRTFEQFTWAARNTDRLSRRACRDYAVANFSLDRVARMYDEYFWGVARVANGTGWYAERNERRDFDWLTKSIPTA